ncbi:hypothetical protein SDC9_184531 [bioreactor metagenome]|uniref:Uncharacterized protein n=1 Tax=bioreactor metagenome TaxID=1076179 RepID=A0A645HFS2_9ZZZZ
MKFTMPSFATSSPLINPTNAPNIRPITTLRKGSSPHVTAAVANMMPLKPAAQPTERSISPAIMTTLCPSAAVPIKIHVVSIACKLPIDAKFGFMIPVIIHMITIGIAILNAGFKNIFEAFPVFCLFNSFSIVNAPRLLEC